MMGASGIGLGRRFIGGGRVAADAGHEMRQRRLVLRPPPTTARSKSAMMTESPASISTTRLDAKSTALYFAKQSTLIYGDWAFYGVRLLRCVKILLQFDPRRYLDCSAGRCREPGGS